MEWNKHHKISRLFKLIFISIFVIFFLWSVDHQNTIKLLPSIVNPTKHSLINSDDAHVLLIYIYANSHKYAYGNLKYFIETAIHERDGVDYVFILQQVQDKEINETQMPTLPKSNAFYIQHENRCFDFGTIGWFFEKYTVGNPWKNRIAIRNYSDNNHHRKFNLTQYKYFIFMNSSIRGPFFLPYFLKFLLDYQTELNKSLYWYHIFTKRINAKVKLVGCTISCATTPHVQSYFLATDFIGLSILLETGGRDRIQRVGVFGCYSSKSDTIWLSEMAISSEILKSGYMIDCLLTKYQTIDFSNNNYNCTINGNPYMDKNMDGISLEPYEVVFVKYNDKASTADTKERAKLYQRWMEQVKIKNRNL